MDLNDKIWSTIDGAYKMPFDASIPLKKLQLADDQNLIANIFADLWSNLHHQGDVGLASYLTVPQLVTICINKRSFDWNYVGLILVIEHCRQAEHNPQLPKEYGDLYLNALKAFEQYLLDNFKNIRDATALRLTLALFATLNGQVCLGKAIENLDEDIVQEFLSQF